MVDEARETSNSVTAHREPPPSFGMVAHIWGGHLETTDDEPPPAQPAEVALDAGGVELPSQRAPRVKVD
jgi:hypothetical protein